MNRIDRNGCPDLLEKIYHFLETTDRKWIQAYFADEADFKEFSEDEENHILAYTNDHNALCCVMIINESAILTTAFSREAESEDCYEQLLKDVETLLYELGYREIYYGDGYYSFGRYSAEKDPFGSFLKEKGFILEAVAYDIRYKDSEGYHVKTKVDQLEYHRLTVDHEILGRYESMAKTLYR